MPWDRLPPSFMKCSGYYVTFVIAVLMTTSYRAGRRAAVIGRQTFNMLDILSTEINLQKTSTELQTMIKSCCTLLVITLASVVQAADKPVHVFILSGQSNMAGMSPKLGFEPEAAKLFPDADVPYIKVAQGGQPIRLWVTEWNEIAKEHGLDSKSAGTKYYEPIVKQFNELLKKYPNPASVTFCWMQGERDAKENLSKAYEAALAKLIENLRRDLKQPEMNFVIGRLSDFGTTAEWEGVREAQVTLAGKDKRGAWVDCDDLNDKEKNGVKRNDLHYTKEGYELLGRRFVRQGKALIESKQPNADGRPE